MSLRDLYRHLLFLLLPLSLFGQVPERKAGTYVNDYTNSLSQGEILQLNEKLLQLENTTTVQMAIVLVNDLPPDIALEDYARDIGNEWKVGIAHNGLVYVAVLNERKQRLEVASNLEGDIPDMTAAEMIDNLKPLLRTREYYRALALLISEVNDHLARNTFTATDTATIPPGYVMTPEETSDDPADDWARERKDFETRKAKYDRLGDIALWFIIGGLVGFCIWASRYKKKYIREHTVNGEYIGVGSAYFASTHPDYSGSSGDSSGGSGFGGFGGSGGGGFSGGGASGSW
jgi:uncharacterized protein